MRLEASHCDWPHYTPPAASLFSILSFAEKFPSIFWLSLVPEFIFEMRLYRKMNPLSVHAFHNQNNPSVVKKGNVWMRNYITSEHPSAMSWSSVTNIMFVFLFSQMDWSHLIQNWCWFSQVHIDAFSYQLCIYKKKPSSVKSWDILPKAFWNKSES